MKKIERLKELMPLTPAVFFILLSLSEGEKHGYALMQTVEHLSEGAVRIGPATLYTTLRRLREFDVIEESSTSAGEDARRRCYRLNRAGRWLLEAETNRLENVVRKARRTLVPNAAR